MAHGVNAMLKKIDGKTGVGSRRIFPPHFKLQVLDSYRNDADCKGNQRATARKYGIHRRQIQKWLQVEGNLRNSVKTTGDVKKSVVSDVALKNRLAVVADEEIEEEDPSSSVSPLPIDYTMRDRLVRASPSVASLSPSYPTSPIDLSLKRPQHCTPVCSPLSPTNSSPPHPSLSPTTTTFAQHRLDNSYRDYVNQSEPNPWDLSTKTTGTKRKSDGEPNGSSKPIKLFKPYLDDINRDNDDDDTTRNSDENNVTNHYYNDYYNNNILHNNNNNNNSIHHQNHNNNNNTIYDTYTIQELHPKNSIIYYYPLYPLYPSPEPPYTTTHSPISYDNNNDANQSNLLPKRQTYSLDFKLSAIDSYYQDDSCRGNQRAVATKYNVHRRQVQKWLQQEDELRQRNDIRDPAVHVLS